jgi:hypothetical protein
MAPCARWVPLGHVPSSQDMPVGELGAQIYPVLENVILASD